MLDVIDSQYADVLTLRKLSASIGRRPAYLGRLFRQEVGSSVREYLTRIRLKHAADLIRHGVKIEAVSLRVGYRSKKGFYQQFEKRYGTTLLAYRSRSGVPSDLQRPSTREICGGAQLLATTADTRVSRPDAAERSNPRESAQPLDKRTFFEFSAPVKLPGLRR